MAIVSCFSALLIGKKKKYKKYPKPIYSRKENGIGDLRVKPEEVVYAPSDKEIREVPLKRLVPLENQVSNGPSTDKKLVGGNKNNEISARTDIGIETAYEGGDEHDDILSMKRDYSDFDLQALAAEKGEINSHDLNQELTHDGLENESEKVDGITPEPLVQSGHVSDPGMGRTASWGSPMLKRSCSNIETKRASKMLRLPSKSQSYNDHQNLPGKFYRDVPKDIPGSPASVMTSCSADKVMLKKRSSSQVLPSRSRKLWWKLFLWSHRNLHRTWSLKPQRTTLHNHASNKKDGYSSDTLEPRCGADLKSKKAMEESVVGSRNGVWPPNQWVAFSAESSSLDRVNAWVHSLDDSPYCPIEDDQNEDDEAAEESAAYSKILEIGESSSRNNNTRTGRHAVEEILQANNLIQSLNSFSSVAHISGMGLKVIPAIAAFTSLRSVNLSGNFIVHISPGSLPKSLHMLDLSRNKIATIEGLRELTRLRVLNLSYNRISRIGHGLSNCILIKELYLAGNKISGVEGLHRLLKLAVLDLSFNKITTARALGQLVANYHSLVALNLLGNPVQSNIGDNQLRKAVCSLLPHLAYLNRQPIKPLRAREAATDSVAKAALGNNGWSSRRRSIPLVKGIGEGSSYRGAGSHAGYRSSKNRSKNRHQHSINRK